MIAINRRRAYGGKVLPYDAEVEYLESTGAQWIDTGVVADSSLGYDFTFRYTTLQQHDMGAIEYISRTYKRNHITGLYTNTNHKLFLSTNNNNLEIGTTDTNLHTISLRTTDSSTYSYDGVSHSMSKVTASINGNFFLFARNNINITPSISYAAMQIYAAKLYLGDTLVRDFIPVRVGTTGYMLDKVEHKLYGNAGTGDFILGPDKT